MSPLLIRKYRELIDIAAMEVERAELQARLTELRIADERDSPAEYFVNLASPADVGPTMLDVIRRQRDAHKRMAAALAKSEELFYAHLEQSRGHRPTSGN